jgi:hypothetical protein
VVSVNQACENAMRAKRTLAANNAAGELIEDLREAVQSAGEACVNLSGPLSGLDELQKLVCCSVSMSRCI